MRNPVILILYNEVMPYLIAGLRAFKKLYPNVSIHLVEVDTNKLTPYQFSEDYVEYYTLSKFTSLAEFKQVCFSLNPDLVIVSGRTHKFYLEIARLLKKRILTVSIQDSQNDYSFRTFIKCLFSSFLYKKYFQCLWVSGPNGFTLANRLSYVNKDIYGFSLSADTDLFFSNFQTDSTLHRTIMFVGRFSVEKNVQLLIDVFQKVNETLTEKWKLILVGGGKSELLIDNMDNIEIYPFMPATQLKKLSHSVDLFCLPSTYEPWGVVVHEFASMGKVLLVSDRCGSVSEFLINGFNGYVFNSLDPVDFKEKMLALFSMENSQLFQMKQNSCQLSRRVTSEMWAGQLNSMLQRSLNQSRL